jgi:hypothetical protein
MARRHDATANMSFLRLHAAHATILRPTDAVSGAIFDIFHFEIIISSSIFPFSIFSPAKRPR